MIKEAHPFYLNVVEKNISCKLLKKVKVLIYLNVNMVFIIHYENTFKIY
jgi:hypothetical protein